MIRIIITALAVFASLIAAAQNMGQMSTMREQMQYYNQLGFTTDAQFDSLHATIPNSVTYPRAACNLNKVVYGWHPYWVGSVYTNYDWSMLSDLCYFSYELNAADGNATSTHSFSTAAVVDEALSQGTRVHLCVTLFSNHGTFLTNATAKQTLITNLINMVGARGGHGVNIDFEGVSSTYKVEFRDFMNDLSDQFHAAIPGSIVSMALPSVDWSTAYEVENMTSVDLFIIMGYDYYYSGSTTAGPNDPLYNYTTGYAYCLTRSVAYYLNKVPAAKLTLGLPYYTRRYETASAALPGSVTGSSAVVMFKDYLTNASGYYDNTLWSSDAFITYYVFQIAGQWNQCFIDDTYSMGRRYDLVNQAGLAGIGIWALGYDDGHPDYWNLIRDKFSDCAVVECADSVFDTGGPNRNYFNNENFPITIAPTNATGLSLQFTSFATENNFDTLFIYDGPTVASPLLGRYTGTNSPGTVVASGTSLTLRQKSDGATTAAGWKAYWQCSMDTTPPQTDFSVNIWETDDFDVHFSDSDNDSLKWAFWNVTDNDGSEWRANGNRGFFNDNFNTAIHPDWTDSAGTWSIISGAINQSDVDVANSNLFIPLNQDSTHAYLYSWKMRIDGGQTSLNRRAGIHFFCDSAMQSNRHNNYMVYFRVDNQKVQLYKYTNNSYIYTDVYYDFQAATWYDIAILFTPEGEFSTFINGDKVITWIDPSPWKWGNYISLRTGNCNASYDDFSVFRSRTTDESITVGTGNDDMARYQNASPTSPACKISTILIDNTNNFSPVLDKTVNIDWTEPVAIGIPAEGTVSDIDTSYSTTNFDGFWNAATDTHSGVAFYEYSIGTTSGATNIVNWTAVATSTSIALSALSLEYDSTYFLSMRCTNAAGLTSTITSSDGVLIQNPVSPDAIFSTAQTTLCAGDSILYNNSSTGATDFEWIFEGGAPASSTLNNPGYITYPTAGQYDVTLIAVNGSQSDTTTLADYIHIYEQPVAAFSATDDTLYLPNAFVAFTNQSQGATSYIWTFGDASSSTETDPWHIYDTTGVYTVVLIANNGACSDSIVSTDAIVVLVISSASAETGEENVRIFPQPVKEYINITLPSGFSGEVRVTITDMTGNIVLAKQCEVVQGSPNIINLHGIAPGNYLLSVSSGESTYSSLLILISE